MAEFIIFTGFLAVLCIGGIVSDYIFPHIAPLNRYIDSLPQMQEESDDE